MPEVARLAKRSIGAIYRRFPDKNALLEAVFRRYFRRLAEQNEASLGRIKASNRQLAALVPVVIRGIVAGQARDRNLAMALYEFAAKHPNERFRDEAKVLSVHALHALREVLLSRRSEIRHSQPDRAVEVVLAAVSLIAQGAIRHAQTLPLINISEDSLVAELTRMVVPYLCATRH